MRLARRALALLIAAAVALAPVGVAAAGLPGADAKAPAHEAHAQHHGHQTHDAMPTADADQAAKHCADKSASSCCCDDDAAACAQTCLQKCFGQMAVMPPDRAARSAPLSRVAPRPAEWPPGWSSAPPPPPPRA